MEADTIQMHTKVDMALMDMALAILDIVPEMFKVTLTPMK